MAPLFNLYVYFAVIFGFTQTSNCTWIRSSVHQGWRIKREFGVSVRAADPMECLRRCLHLHSSLCLAVTFDAAAAKCTHFTKNNTRIMKYGSSSDTAIFTEWASGVIVGQKVPFEEASSVCGSLGGHVMTNTELEQLFNTGAEPRACDCGWLSDGSRKKVKRLDEGCGPGNSIVACTGPSTIQRTWCTVNAE